MDRSNSIERQGGLEPFASIIMTPGFEPWQLETAAEHAHSVVIVANALGSLSRRLHETVRKIIESGKPIFILPDTPDSDHGILQFNDELQVNTRNTGVTFLSKANVNHEPVVCEAIRIAVNEGLEGDKLRAAIVHQFS